jgi:hypothetical protein
LTDQNVSREKLLNVTDQNENSNDSSNSCGDEIGSILDINSNQIFLGMISTQYKAKIVRHLSYVCI